MINNLYIFQQKNESHFESYLRGRSEQSTRWTWRQSKEVHQGNYQGNCEGKWGEVDGLSQQSWYGPEDSLNGPHDEPNSVVGEDAGKSSTYIGGAS